MSNKEQETPKPESKFEKRMRLKRELLKTINTYDINTRTIYYHLQDKWEKYDTRLLNRVEEGLHHAHNVKNVMTYCNDGSDTAKNKITGHIKRFLENSKGGEYSPEGFPITYYYIGGHYNGMEYIICFDENCIVEKDTFGFDLLFAVQFSLTPILECRKFLTYQLKKSFNNNITEFVEYLDNICLEYSEFLAEKHERFCRKYIGELNPIPKETAKPNLKTISSHRVKLNWQGQSNTLTFLFRQLKVNVNPKGESLVSNSYDEVAQFLKDNFEGYENVKLSTIVGQLKKTDKPKKANKKIELYV